jgi:hypothetical protein
MEVRNLKIESMSDSLAALIASVETVTDRSSQNQFGLAGRFGIPLKTALHARLI